VIILASHIAIMEMYIGQEPVTTKDALEAHAIPIPILSSNYIRIASEIKHAATANA